MSKLHIKHAEVFHVLGSLYLNWKAKYYNQKIVSHLIDVVCRLGK
jgi:hypothetical protein